MPSIDSVLIVQNDQKTKLPRTILSCKSDMTVQQSVSIL
jgi:hypothetical protein